MKDTLIVLSGGLDSTTMLYEYQYRIGMAVSFHYGSNHNDRELEFAKLHCERLGIPHLVIRLPFIKQLSMFDVLKDTIPFTLIAAVVMVATHYATLSITNLWLLLLIRIMMAAALYLVAMRLLNVAILKECLQFIRKKQ